MWCTGRKEVAADDGDTKKWVLSRNAKLRRPRRKYAAHRLDTVLDKFLKTAARLQEKLLKPEVSRRQGAQIEEKAAGFCSATAGPAQAEQAGCLESNILRRNQTHEVMFIEQKSMKNALHEPLRH